MAQDPASSQLILRLKNSGTTLVTRTSGLLNIDCPTGGCTWTSATNTYAITAGGGGGGGATGPSGPSGPSGPNGPSGPSGPVGATGADGPSGPSGPIGANGADGATGATGPSGPSGPSGAAGPSGPSGPVGATGATGPSGPSGASGPSGPGSTSRTLSLLNGTVLPDTSGNVYFQPYPILATNDFWKHGIWAFLNPSADETIYGTMQIPSVYAQTSLVFTARINSTVTSGTAAGEFGYRCVADAASLDQSSAQETLNATVSIPGTANQAASLTFTATASNCSAGNILEWYFARDDSADTVAGTYMLHTLTMVAQ